MRPKITIIVATHNRPDFLFRCLLAIQKQTMKEFECLVVADQCNYSQNVFCEFAKDNRFKYFKTIIKTPNCGSVSKNVGLKNSSTDYICYCDDDNILLPNHLHDLYSAIISKKQDIIFSHTKEILYQQESIFNILDHDLYYQAEDGKYETNVTHKDALVMIHKKKPALEIGGWKTMHELNSYNEDGWFMATLQNKVKNNSLIIDAVTAIYYQHWSINGDIKDDLNYKYLLKQLTPDQLYVYPELIDKLRKKYII